MGHVHSRNRSPRAGHKEFARFSAFLLARGRSSRNLSADYFTAIPAGERVPLPSISSREDPVRLRAELIERVFCRSIGRRRRIGGRGRKKKKKDSRRGSAREREGGRKRQTDEEGRSEWRERRATSVAVTRTPVGPQCGKTSLARPT